MVVVSNHFLLDNHASQRLCLPSSLSSAEPVLGVNDEVEEARVIALAISSAVLALFEASLVTVSLKQVLGILNDNTSNNDESAACAKLFTFSYFLAQFFANAAE